MALDTHPQGEIIQKMIALSHPANAQAVEFFYYFSL